MSKSGQSTAELLMIYQRFLGVSQYRHRCFERGMDQSASYLART